MLMFLHLNDDCLYGICAFLELDDLLSMKNVCKRLDMIVKLIWRHQCKSLTIKYNQMLKFKETNQKDFIDLMTSASEMLEELTIENIESVQLKWICHLRFSKLNVLECHIPHNNKISNDDDIILLGKIFPFINKLVLTSSTTGKYIKNMHMLTELDLTCCEYLNINNLTEIFSKLKLRKFTLLYYGHNTMFGDELSTIVNCHTLEELTIDDHYLLIFIDKLLYMPQMRQILCYTRDYDVILLGKLARVHSERMHTLILNNVFWSNDRHVANIRSMSNLERFVLIDDDIEDEQLEVLAKDFKCLKELHVRSSRLESDEGVLEIVRNCRNLEVLNVTKSNISKDFLKNIVGVLSEIKRTGPLKLYCGKTVLEDHIFIKDNKLQISKDDPFLDLARWRHFLCEWHTFVR